MRQRLPLLILLSLSGAVACADSAPAPITGLSPIASLSATVMAAPDRASFDNVLFFVRGGPPTFPTLTMMSPASTLLWEARAHQPVIAPDGHQVTLGEWISASGRASTKCIEGGTHVVLHFSDLLPNATYTVWQLTFK